MAGVGIYCEFDVPAAFPYGINHFFGFFERDYPVVQASMILISLSFVLVNLLTDIVYGFFDPKIRYQ